MSFNMQLNGAIIETQRQIDDQRMKLNGYKTQLETAKKTASSLDQNAPVVQQMIAALEITEKKIDNAVAQLNAAKEKLSQVGLNRR